MLNNIQKLFGQIRNPQSLGILALVAIVLLVSWSGVKAIATNYELQKQISALMQQNEVQQLENDNLRLKNAYFNTNSYLELTARRVFGKAAPGEKLLLVPKEVALKHTVDLSASEKDAPKETALNKPWYQKNLEAWRDFLLH